MDLLTSGEWVTASSGLQAVKHQAVAKEDSEVVRSLSPSMYNSGVSHAVRTGSVVDAL